MASKRKYALLVVLSSGGTYSGRSSFAVLMAGPMYLLYEVSIIVSRFVKAKKKADDEAEAEFEAEPEIEDETEK